VADGTVRDGGITWFTLVIGIEIKSDFTIEAAAVSLIAKAKCVIYINLFTSY
jgi:hypothetical protein